MPRIRVQLAHANKRPLYERVKHQLDTQLGIQNICVVASSFTTKELVLTGSNDGFKELNGLISQIGLKLNIKAGGHNQKLYKSAFNCIDLKRTMLVGFEVIVPPKKAHGNAKGIAAMVASSNHSLSQWLASMKVLNKKPVHEELVNLLVARLHCWKKQDKEFPRGVIVYYNNMGVKYGSNGTTEMANIQAIWVSKYKEAHFDESVRPRLVVIAVNKDHQAQLRTLSSIGKAKEEEKIPQETVLVRTSGDDNAQAWEFVVQGHQPIKTAKLAETPMTELEANKATTPIRYTVLKNEMFKTAEEKMELENLTDNMRYLSGCNTFAITDTLPIYYVELLGQRLRSYVRAWYYPANRKTAIQPMTEDSIKVHDDVAETMFYV